MQSTYYAATRRFFAPVLGRAPSAPEPQRHAGEALADQLRLLEDRLQSTGTLRHRHASFLQCTDREFASLYQADITRRLWCRA